MMEWKLENGLLTLYVGDVPYNLTGNQILDIEEGKKVEVENQIVPSVSSQLDKIDFSDSFFFSSIQAEIYIPIQKNDMMPFCQFVVEDPSFKRHDVSFLVTDYIVVAGLFLLIDSRQSNDLKGYFKVHASGPIGFKQIALLQKERPSYVRFIDSDEKCSKSVLQGLEYSKTRSFLYPYQLQGVEWMDTVISEDTGFVLADEMGLGKTVQIITVIDEQRGHGPSLLIAPNSLMENWSRELRRFAPWISFMVDAGKTREHNFRKLRRFDLIITSYDIARSDFAVFESIEWNLIVLDEAQNIKNYTAQKSKEIKRYPKRSGIAVTGTPFENHITDIWSIYDFCFPGLLGTIKEFKSEFKDNYESAENLENIISPLMLRRKVRDVRNDLPDKVITPIALEMDQEEAEGYERLRLETIDENEKLNLGMLAKLRSYCALPMLADFDQRLISPAKSSAKFSYLFESILDEIFSMKEKALIFTGFIGAQDAICENVRARYGAFCKILNGSVPIEDRQKIIDDFSNHIGFAVLIINPVVGSAGLNITAANHVVFYTLDWNPATEDQCIARAARIGQSRTVFVYRLFYSGTVEDEVNDCLEEKRKLQETAVKGTTADIKPDIKKALQRSPFMERRI